MEIHALWLKSCTRSAGFFIWERFAFPFMWKRTPILVITRFINLLCLSSHLPKTSMSFNCVSRIWCTSRSVICSTSPSKYTFCVFKCASCTQSTKKEFYNCGHLKENFAFSWIFMFSNVSNNILIKNIWLLVFNLCSQLFLSFIRIIFIQLDQNGLNFKFYVAWWFHITFYFYESLHSPCADQIIAENLQNLSRLYFCGPKVKLK